MAVYRITGARNCLDFAGEVQKCLNEDSFADIHKIRIKPYLQEATKVEEKAEERIFTSVRHATAAMSTGRRLR